MSSRIALLVTMTLAGCGRSELEEQMLFHGTTSELAVLPPTEEHVAPYLRGKVALIRSLNRPYEEPIHMMEYADSWTTFFAGRESFLARSMSEVGTVARLDCDVQAGATYVSEAGIEHQATREECVLILVDRSVPAIIHREPFSAPAEPDTVHFDPTRGIELEVPMWAVMRYLDELPRR